MEGHQQRAENTKAFLVGIYHNRKCVYPVSHKDTNLFYHPSRLLSDLSCSCSEALKTTTSFLSTPFISPRHSEVEQESLHLILQKAQYLNYMLDGLPARPLVGVNATETIGLVKISLDLDVLVVSTSGNQLTSPFI
jgi:hypothetical protein